MKCRISNLLYKKPIFIVRVSWTLYSLFVIFDKKSSTVYSSPKNSYGVRKLLSLCHVFLVDGFEIKFYLLNLGNLCTSFRVYYPSSYTHRLSGVLSQVDYFDLLRSHGLSPSLERQWVEMWPLDSLGLVPSRETKSVRNLDWTPLLTSTSLPFCDPFSTSVKRSRPWFSSYGKI